MTFLQNIKCFLSVKAESSVTVFLIEINEYDSWLKKQNTFTQNFLANIDFSKKNNTTLVPNSDGNIGFVLSLVSDDMFSIANLPKELPEGDYHIESNSKNLELLYLGFGLGCYNFDKYKKINKKDVRLFLPKEYFNVISQVEAVSIARDMISTPAEDMSPEDVSNIIKDMAKEFGAKVSELVGEELAENGYMGIYTVGKGSHRKPRLVNLNWGKEDAPKISLVGKGVVFDTGGVDVKPAAGMLLMHKDMGGAANAIALAYLIMKNNLSVNLSLSVPTVENAIDAHSYRPSDIIKMKDGTTVQVVNTDAEGRLILAEPLSEESKKKPDILMDFATLTGAARVSVGTEISAFFSNSDELSNLLQKHADVQQDDVWRLPLAKRYSKFLKNDFADLANCGPTPFGGAITAALFLEHFIDKDFSNWIHFDIMAWNNSATAGKPIGGEAMGIRAAYAMICDKFC